MNHSVPFPPSLHGQLIVSCQASPGDPLDDVDALTRIALSAIRGGAGGLRASGADCIAACRRRTRLPIIGIFKRYIDGEAQITPDFASASAVLAAGADAVAIDCTGRCMAESWRQILLRVHDELNKPVLADIASFEQAAAAAEAGADAVATTLCGYTPETAGHRSVNWELVARLVREMPVPVIVEGHVTEPYEVRRALDLGAYAVVVGSAITRPEWITARFVNAMRE